MANGAPHSEAGSITPAPLGLPFAPSLARTSTGGGLDDDSLANSASCGTAGCHSEILAKPRQVDVLLSQGRLVAEAIRMIGVTPLTITGGARSLAG